MRPKQTIIAQTHALVLISKPQCFKYASVWMKINAVVFCIHKGR